ncbi:hypothetical protein R1sor_021138 [Riccia sorocarpa]|uniref:Uncharacterized protein n=1 Tax=Riccia sorocarpa TaxID=122646 RepID=A0ABD3GG69_9MARC
MTKHTGSKHQSIGKDLDIRAHRLLGIKPEFVIVDKLWKAICYWTMEAASMDTHNARNIPQMLAMARRKNLPAMAAQKGGDQGHDGEEADGSSQETKKTMAEPKLLSIMVGVVGDDLNLETFDILKNSSKREPMPG